MFDPELMRYEIINNVRSTPVETLQKVYDAVTGNIQENYCPNCGNNFRGPDRFCSYCGVRREFLIVRWQY